VRHDLVRLAQRQSGLLTAEQLDGRVLGDEWCQVQPSVFAPVVVTLDREATLEAIRLSLDPRERRTGTPWALQARPPRSYSD
jgi:hypothetical protein